MTPAERLLAAADLLDKRAGEASQPWKVDDDNFLAMPWIQMPYTIGPKAGSATEFYEMAGADDKTTRYIATMHPEVGKAVAKMLREAGETILENVRHRIPQGIPPELVNTSLLDLADLLLAGAS